MSTICSKVQEESPVIIMGTIVEAKVSTPLFELGSYDRICDHADNVDKPHEGDGDLECCTKAVVRVGIVCCIYDILVELGLDKTWNSAPKCEL